MQVCPPCLIGGDQIGIDDPRHVNVLMALDHGQSADAVADQPRRLEVERRRRRLHLCREPPLHRTAAARQKGVRLLDQPGIVLAADAADAGRAAPLDLMQQARPGAVGEDAVAARAQEKGLLQRDQGAVDRAGRGERAEIAAARALRAAVLGQLRKVVIGGQMDQRKRFVVAQQHVEARHQPLDHVAFEQQRFRLGMGRDDLHRRGFGDHATQPVRQSRRMGIILHPAPQVARLADIERVALTVEHAVDAGGRRHGLQRGCGSPRRRRRSRSRSASPARSASRALRPGPGRSPLLPVAGPGRVRTSGRRRPPRAPGAGPSAAVWRGAARVDPASAAKLPSVPRQPVGLPCQINPPRRYPRNLWITLLRNRAQQSQNPAYLGVVLIA